MPVPAPAPSHPFRPAVRALFIYYRVPTAEAGRAASAVREAQARLMQTHPGLVAQLWQRPQARDGQLTWMEVYRHPQGVSAALQAQIDAALAVAAPWITGPRHVEVFMPCVW